MGIIEKFAAIADDEHLEFDRVENKRSLRPDLHAFIILDELDPGIGGDIICHASHDLICLGIREEIVEALTDAQVLELTRCGVMCSDGYLEMFT